MSNIASNAIQSISGNKNYQQQQQQMAENNYIGSKSPNIYTNFNLNSNTNGFNNDQTRNRFENGNNDFSNDNDRMKPLLPMPPPSYPIKVKQYSPSSLDHESSFTEVLQPYQNFGGENVRQQNGAFSSSNNIGQFATSSKYSGQPNGYNAQLPSGRTFNGLSNTVVRLITFN